MQYRDNIFSDISSSKVLKQSRTVKFLNVQTLAYLILAKHTSTPYKASHKPRYLLPDKAPVDREVKL